MGDSRAIIVDKKGNVKQLTRDHKPDCRDEQERIIREGGRVHPLKHPLTGQSMGPARVWLK